MKIKSSNIIMQYQLRLNKVKTNKGKTNKGKTNKARLNKVKTNKARLNKVKTYKSRFRNNLKKTYKNIKKGGIYHQQGHWRRREPDSVLDLHEPAQWEWVDTSYYTCDNCGNSAHWQGDEAHQHHYCSNDCELSHWASLSKYGNL